MKPGNLFGKTNKVPNPAAKRKMRIRYTAHIESSVCGFFFLGTVSLSLRGAKRRGNPQKEGDCHTSLWTGSQ